MRKCCIDVRLVLFSVCFRVIIFIFINMLLEHSFGAENQCGKLALKCDSVLFLCDLERHYEALNKCG